MSFRENITESGFKELNRLVKEKGDIRNVKEEDLIITKRTLNLLLTWIERVYALTEDQKRVLEEPDIDLEKLYIFKE